MRFFELMKEWDEGKTLKRKCWNRFCKGYYKGVSHYEFSGEELKADDWYAVEEEKPEFKTILKKCRDCSNCDNEGEDFFYCEKHNRQLTYHNLYYQACDDWQENENI